MPLEGTVESPLVVSTYTRPVRVAYLVHASEVTLAQIDQLIRCSVGRWGGRFDGIFPTDGTGIGDEWWKALVALDPDVVFSLIPLQDSLIRRLDRFISPALIHNMTDAEQAR